jgi:FlaA1/EpsC-like NDP-sugar epimerase
MHKLISHWTKLFERKINNQYEKLFRNRPNPRWLVFLFDIIIVLFSFFLAFLLRFNFKIPYEYRIWIWKFLPIVIIYRSCLFLIFRTYAGTMRYSGFSDLIRISVLGVISSIILLGINLLLYIQFDFYPIPLSVIVIDSAISSWGMISLRIAVKMIYREFNYRKNGKIKTAIVGTREQVLLILRMIDMDNRINSHTIAIFDPHRINAGIDLHGIRTYHIDQMKEIIELLDIGKIILPKDSLPVRLMNKIADLCLDYDVKVLVIQNIHSRINGKLPPINIRDISIEDLLERDPIQLNVSSIFEFIKDKKVLITGAAGSIGSEIVRQVSNFQPGHLILLDMAETPLHFLDLELSATLSKDLYTVIVGNVCDEDHMNHIFATYKPEIIYHAAAYKHVPLMEENPCEAVKTNVHGTSILANCAAHYSAETFIMVSTDKAVNPTNIMGATKRIAEMYVQACGQISETKFMATRFGNVLGSNGSAIPIFQKQIQNGGPVTITHPEITRYFMTISEASQLVLEASASGKGGEVFLFDMGKSVKIVDLVRKMIRLAGLIPDVDIKIKFIGLRPGEKLYEELLYRKENSLPTAYPKILISQGLPVEFSKISQDVQSLKFPAKHNNVTALVAKMKEIVPEFISNNSVFCKLDQLHINQN